MIVITSTTNDPGLLATAGYQTVRGYEGTDTNFNSGRTESFKRTQNFFETGVTTTRSYTARTTGQDASGETRWARTSVWGSTFSATNQTGRTTLYTGSSSWSTDATPNVPASTNNDADDEGTGGLGTVALQIHQLASTYLTTSTWVDYSTQIVDFLQTIVSASSSIQGTATQFGTFTTTRESTSRGIYGTSVGEDEEWDGEEYVIVTFPDTDYDNYVVQTVTSTYKSSAVSETVTLDGARTYRISFPDYGITLYNPVVSSAPFAVSEASALQTTDSLVWPSVYSFFDYQKLPVDNITDDSNYSIFTRMFVSTLQKEETTFALAGQSVQTSQWREPVSGQWSTNTRNRVGPGVLAGTVNIATGLSTYDAPAHMTVGVFAQSTHRHTATLVTGTVTTTVRPLAGNTTYTNKSFLVGTTFIPTTIEPPIMIGGTGDIRNTYQVTSNNGFTAQTGRGFELITRIYQGVSNGAEVGKPQMGDPTNFGMGMTGVPDGWLGAGRAFNYSAVSSREGGPILVPFGGSYTTGVTRYTGAVNANSATITRLITNFTAYSHTTDSASFEWDTVLPTVDPFFGNARHIHYLHPATHAYSGVLQVKNSDTISTHTGFYSTAAAPGERVIVNTLVSVFPFALFSGRIVEAGSTSPRA